MGSSNLLRVESQAAKLFAHTILNQPFGHYVIVPLIRASKLARSR